MEEIMRLLGFQQQQQPQVDRDGIALPPPPGGMVGQQPQQNDGLMAHYGNVMGNPQTAPNGQQMDPAMLQMLMQLLGKGQ